MVSRPVHAILAASLAAALALSVGCARNPVTPTATPAPSFSQRECLEQLLKAKEGSQTHSQRLLRFRESFIKPDMVQLYHTNLSAYLNLVGERIDTFIAANPDIPYKRHRALLSNNTVVDIRVFTNPDPRGIVAELYFDSTGGIGLNYNPDGECR